MNVKNDISEELGSLSALVATISRETPYRAPEGYFLSFPTVVLERVQPGRITTAREVPPVAGLEGPALGTSPSGALESANKPLTFNVPEGYFEGFAEQVLGRIKAGSTGSGPSAESEGLSRRTSPSEASGGEDEVLPAILIQAGRITPYSVPEGYFDGLSPILTVLKDKNPYLVPAGYFEGLAAAISGKASKQRELSRSATAIEPDSSGRLEMPEEDHGRSETRVIPSRVIPLGKRMSWMKYAAAAVVAGLIVMAGWTRWHTTTPPVKQLAAVQPATPAEIAKNLSKVSDADLQNFLVDQDTTLAQPVGNIGAMATVDMNDSELLEMNDKGLKSLLGDVTDGELKQYMDEHGGASDIATN